MCGHHTGVICSGSLPPMVAARERSEFYVKSPFRAPLLIFPRGFLRKSFPHWGYFRKTTGVLSKSVASPRRVAKGY